MKKISKGIIIVSLIGLLLTGCSSQATNQQNEEELEKIIISEMRGESWLPVYLAEELGYFEEEGLATEFVVYKDGPIAFQGMHAGDSQFCMLSTEPVLRAYEEGLESTIILPTVKSKQYMFASNSEITSIEQLKGKAIFGGMPGSAPYSFVASALEEAGMTVNDVEWINMEYGAALAALEQGSLSAAFFDGIYINKLEDINANILINTSDPEKHKEIYGTERYESQMVTVTKKFAQENPETVQKFVNAVMKAIQWQTEHSDEEVARVVAPMFEGKDMVEIIGILRSSLTTDGNYSKEGYEAIEKFCVEQGILESPVGYENIIDMKYVNHALEVISKNSK
ncbi:ABC transporter substrate-binding protein [Irregularibacter muris]|uniref:ABC transporter substrate-binding protein n=1 Tax=Irregularibacter muris TaxID=1796619 RepID=A0AAE3HJM3_9FIRM|nr:ABC transporter substrate-binding protein [Irregularibacter muris]MCR1899933.1 ABC transporter substrate-binding protein [Irregularibacter muris]